jgi:hypothetical protein
MARVADHLSVGELQAGYRGSSEATRARHDQVIWLLAQWRSCTETAAPTGFARRWWSSSSPVTTPSDRRAWATGGGTTAPSRDS